MKLKPITLDLGEKLKNRRYRTRFLSTLARDEIAAQIRQLRIKRGFATQQAFAKDAGMQQSAVSRIEQSSYSGWTFHTLLKVASALSARLRVTFEPIEDVVGKSRRSERAAQLQSQTVDDGSHGSERTADDAVPQTNTVWIAQTNPPSSATYEATGANP